jgi:hypothetical protein
MFYTGSFGNKMYEYVTWKVKRVFDFVFVGRNIGGTRSKAWVYGRSLAGTVGSNPTGGMDECLFCVLSGRGLCVGLITRPEECYQVWYV